MRLEAERDSLLCPESTLEKCGREEDRPPRLLCQTQLALDELAINVNKDGYGRDWHSFKFAISSSAVVLAIDFPDASWVFNPLSNAPWTDLDARLKDRSVGAGVQLVRYARGMAGSG